MSLCVTIDFRDTLTTSKISKTCEKWRGSHSRFARRRPCGGKTIRKNRRHNSSTKARNTFTTVRKCTIHTRPTDPQMSTQSAFPTLYYAQTFSRPCGVRLQNKVEQLLKIWSRSRASCEFFNHHNGTPLFAEGIHRGCTDCE